MLISFVGVKLLDGLVQHPTFLYFGSQFCVDFFCLIFFFFESGHSLASGWSSDKQTKTTIDFARARYRKLAKNCCYYDGCHTRTTHAHERL